MHCCHQPPVLLYLKKKKKRNLLTLNYIAQVVEQKILSSDYVFQYGFGTASCPSFCSSIQMKELCIQFLISPPPMISGWQNNKTVETWFVISVFELELENFVGFMLFCFSFFWPIKTVVFYWQRSVCSRSPHQKKMRIWLAKQLRSDIFLSTVFTCFFRDYSHCKFFILWEKNICFTIIQATALKMNILS